VLNAKLISLSKVISHLSELFPGHVPVDDYLIVYNVHVFQTVLESNILINSHCPLQIQFLDSL
jgi:hypothetical protein